ncbi:uncharacterized protein LOC142635148 [Castanea sativa]|uniref:uncharacterized protein LOC142635148 n=1 Tax=Castanea sativa TaxID=21020 RepID=UPI003F64E07D
MHPKAFETLLEELNEGICGSHTRGKSLAHRALTQGYWWPDMQKQALEYSLTQGSSQPYIQFVAFCLFGVPRVLISDNGLKFDNKAFRRYYSDLGIVNKYFTPSYPQSNGQAEATNKSIVNGLKKRLDDSKGRWAKELPNVLWAY